MHIPVLSPALWSLSLGMLFVGLRVIRKHLFGRPASINILPGPPSDSWLVGNIPQLLRPETMGEAESEWVEKYGTAIKIKGAFNQDIVYLVDGRALNHILNTCGYNFRKPKETIGFTRMFTGNGLIAVEGADHARHRRIMNPAFSYTSLRGFLPVFTRTAEKAARIWREHVMQTGDASPIMDVAKWLPRLTLDVIGETALNYNCGSLDDGENELAKLFENLLVDTFHDPSDIDIAFKAIWGYVPAWTFSALRNIPLHGMGKIRNFQRVAFGVAQRLVDSEVTAIASGKPPGKDAMSILIRANHGENPRGKLSNEELLAETTTLLFAGHETTASTLVWFLYELSRHPDYQEKVRQEIKATRERIAAGGSKALNANDYDSMSYLVAAMKETLRLHPIGVRLMRVASQDETIPLSTPQRSRTGQMFSSVTVSKGQKVLLSVWAYNRLKILWGENAHEWRPERFLEGGAAIDASKTGFGLYANLGTFSSGVYGCIGWRFALLEMQAIMIELLSNFEFAPAGDDVEIIQVQAALVTPMVKGKREEGKQLPLRVTPL